MTTGVDLFGSGHRSPAGSARMSEVKFVVLGPVGACADGKPISVTGPTTLTLFAGLLVSANQVVPSQTLIEWAWPGQRPGNPRGALQNALSRLRKLIGEDSVTTYPWGYALHADADRLDLMKFRALSAAAAAATAAGRAEPAVALLDEAIGLWSQPVLANVPSEVLLRDWVPHLTGQYLTAIEQRAALRLQLRRAVGLPEELSELVREHPFRETLTGHLMVALCLTGRRTEAFAAFHTLRQLLSSELGIAPSLALQGLYDSIVHDFPSYDTWLGGWPTTAGVG